MKLNLSKMIIGGTLAACMVAALPGLTGSALASARGGQVVDPTVIVVRGAPSSPCKVTTYNKVGAKMVAVGSSSCTVMSTYFVPMSQARSAGVPFVVLPPRDASASELATANQEIDALFLTGDSRTQSPRSAAILSPTVGCGGVYSKQAQWSPSWDASTTYLSDIDYQPCPNNSVYLQNSIIYLLNGKSWYWKQDQYAGGTWGRSCQQPSTNGNVGGMNSTHTAGYYYEPIISEGSNCYPWDTTSTVNIGPVS